MMKDAGVLKCPMCIVPKKNTQNLRWDMHAPNHGMVQNADASSYLKGDMFARSNGGPVDCMSNPGGVGCAGPH